MIAKMRQKSMSMKSRYSQGTLLPPIIIIVFLVFIILPWVARILQPSSATFINSLFFDVFTYCALGAAWNIIGGFGRQSSWAHSSFLAIGAYASFILYSNFNISPLIGILVSMVLAMILAIVIGLPTFRLSGVYFTLGTIATCAIVRQVLLAWEAVTNGAGGLILSYTKVNDILNLRFTSNIYYYYIMLFVMMISFGVMIAINRGKLGYYLKAISQNQIAAQSLGIDSIKIKITAFIISAMLTAMVGVIFAFKTQYLEPDAVATIDLSTKIVLVSIIGGIGTEWGPLLGGVVLIPMLQILNTFFGQVFNGALAQTSYGAILVLLVIFLPNGLLSIKEVIKSRVKRRRKIDTPIKDKSQIS